MPGAGLGLLVDMPIPTVHKTNVADKTKVPSLQRTNLNMPSLLHNRAAYTTSVHQVLASGSQANNLNHHNSCARATFFWRLEFM